MQIEEVTNNNIVHSNNNNKLEYKRKGKPRKHMQIRQRLNELKTKLL